MPANAWIAAPVRAERRPANPVWKKAWLCCGLLLSVFSARAEAPTPPREFWDYLMEFSDTNGEVFDPADLAAIEKIHTKIPAEKLPAEKSEAPSTNPEASRPVNEKPAAAGESKP